MAPPSEACYYKGVYPSKSLDRQIFFQFLHIQGVIKNISGALDQYTLITSPYKIIIESPPCQPCLACHFPCAGRCQEEFEVREMYLHNEPERVCGYTLFLAELFTQLVTVNGRPYDILRGALCHLLTTLLSQPTDANLKCVAQVLKVSVQMDSDRSHLSTSQQVQGCLLQGSGGASASVDMNKKLSESLGIYS